MTPHAAPAFVDLINKFSAIVAGVFRELLETKHLYQNLHVEFNPEKAMDLKLLPPGTEAQASAFILTLVAKKWLVHFGPNSITLAPGPITGELLVPLRPPDVKLYCAHCDRSEPFNLLMAYDIFDHPAITSTGHEKNDETVQIFVLSYLCQSCKRVPEVFLVRRDGFRLSLCGRSPIEHIDVPKVIPKAIHRFFSGAVVAYQSGQTLAGLFLLRTLIEQWARVTTLSKDLKADQVLDAYMASLPDDFKSRFHSFQKLYADLSADIHIAGGSNELFEDAIRQIVEHFDARRLFKI
jgi:hypothetical protein